MIHVLEGILQILKTSLTFLQSYLHDSFVFTEKQTLQKEEPQHKETLPINCKDQTQGC